MVSSAIHVVPLPSNVQWCFVNKIYAWNNMNDTSQVEITDGSDLWSEPNKKRCAGVSSLVMFDCVIVLLRSNVRKLRESAGFTDARVGSAYKKSGPVVK